LRRAKCSKHTYIHTHTKNIAKSAENPCNRKCCYVANEYLVYLEQQFTGAKRIIGKGGHGWTWTQRWTPTQIFIKYTFICMHQLIFVPNAVFFIFTFTHSLCIVYGCTNALNAKLLNHELGLQENANYNNYGFCIIL